MRTLLTLACTILTLGFVGCGGDGRPKPTAVEAVATFKGKPATGALVVLHPTDPAREKVIGGKPFGKVKEDGTIAITTYEQGDGAPEGDYGVTVQWIEEAGPGKFSLSSEGGVGNDKLGGRYSDPRAPKIKFTVTKNGPNKLELKLE